MRAPFIPSFVFNRREKPRRSTEVIVASVASSRACNRASRIMESVWSAFIWRENAGRYTGEGIGSSMVVVARLDPPHHAKATNIVEIDGLEPEEAEVGEIDPVTAIFMAGKVPISSRSRFAFRHRLGMADHRRPRGSKRVAAVAGLHGKKTASWVSPKILGMHCHVADKKDRPALGSSANGIREPKGNPGFLRDTVDRVATEVSERRVRMRSAWLGSGSCRQR